MRVSSAVYCGRTLMPRADRIDRHFFSATPIASHHIDTTHTAMANTGSLLTRLSSQIHITVTPPLNSLGESRQVLAALQKFGEVVTFRNQAVSCIQHHPSLHRSPVADGPHQYDVWNKKHNREKPILAIFESNEAAQRALDASPLTVTLSPPAHATPSSFPSPSAAAAANPALSAPQPREVTCFMQLSRHNHARTLKRNPFHSVWYIDKESPIYKDMMSHKTAIPIRELADVLQRPKPTRSQQARDSIRETNLRLGAESLMELWREGMESPGLERKERMEMEMEREREREMKGEWVAKTGLKRVSLERLGMK